MKGFTLRSPDKPRGRGRSRASSPSTRRRSWQSAPVDKDNETHYGAAGKLQRMGKRAVTTKTRGQTGEKARVAQQWYICAPVQKTPTLPIFTFWTHGVNFCRGRSLSQISENKRCGLMLYHVTIADENLYKWLCRNVHRWVHVVGLGPSLILSWKL